MDITRKVAAGAFVLDQAFPEWWTVVDDKLLDVGVYSACVLGMIGLHDEQAFSGVDLVAWPREDPVSPAFVKTYEAHRRFHQVLVEALRRSEQPDLDLDPAALPGEMLDRYAADLGFDLPLPVMSEGRWDDMREAWLWEIEERRLKGYGSGTNYGDRTGR